MYLYFLHIITFCVCLKQSTCYILSWTFWIVCHEEEMQTYFLEICRLLSSCILFFLHVRCKDKGLRSWFHFSILVSSSMSIDGISISFFLHYTIVSKQFSREWSVQRWIYRSHFLHFFRNHSEKFHFNRIDVPCFFNFFLVFLANAQYACAHCVFGISSISRFLFASSSENCRVTIKSCSHNITMARYCVCAHFIMGF